MSFDCLYIKFILLKYIQKVFQILQTTSKQLPGYGADQYELIADSFIFHENTLWVADEVLPPSRAHSSQISGLSNITLLYCLEKIYILHVRCDSYYKCFHCNKSINIHYFFIL